MKILVSACLLGLNCKYDGGNNLREDILSLSKKHEIVPVCPEQMGGLTTPRIACEQQKDGRVLNLEGRDCTEEFVRGAENCLMLYKALNCDMAILKARSPSCGKGIVYDGSFTHKRIKGNGVFAQMCVDEGIKIISEEEFNINDF